MMKVTDPVCGMEIDGDAAGAIEEYEGRSYHFCSTQCRDTFKADPAKYAATGVQGEPEQPGCGHHGKHSGHGCCH